MAGKKKSRVEEDMEDDKSNELDGPVTTIPLDLTATEPCEWDPKYLLPLLQQQFLKAPVDLQELAEIITSQQVGCVSREDVDEDEEDIADDDDEVVYSFLTVVNLSGKKEKRCVKQIKALLKEKCEECGCPQARQFSALLDNPGQDVGLILNERFINLPTLLAVPSFRSLRDDIAQAQAKKQPFKFGHYILIAKTCVPISEGRQRAAAAAAASSLHYRYEEEQLISELADFSFSYSVMLTEQDVVLDGKWDGTRDTPKEPFRTVMVFSSDKLDAIVSSLEKAMANT